MAPPPYSLAGRHRVPEQNAFVCAAACDGSAGSLALAVAAPKGGGALSVLDPGTLQERQRHAAPHGRGAPLALAFLEGSPHGLLSSGEDGSVHLWDVRAGGAQRTLVERGKEPALALAADGRMCAVSLGRGVRALELASGRELFAGWDAHSEEVACLAFREGELVSAGEDGLLCALDLHRCELGGKAVEDDAGIRLMVNLGEGAKHLSLAGADRGLACVVSTTEVLQLWSLHARRPGAQCGGTVAFREEERLRVGESDGFAVAVLHDGERSEVLAGGVDGRLVAYHLNLDGVTALGALPAGGHKAVVRTAVRLGDSGRMATGGEDGLVCCWAPDVASVGEAAPPPPKKKRWK